jgi:hypothetical protein
MQPMSQPQQTVKLEGITVDELNAILEAIGNLPFNRVAALIPKLVNQAQAQLNPQTPPAEGQNGATQPSNLDGGTDTPDEAEKPATPPVH